MKWTTRSPIMAVVAKHDALARVDRDLSLGHVHPAMQRLASLVAAYPEDFDLRARRAALNRQIGNAVEAGRWGFLTEEVTAPEVHAWEAAEPRAWARLSALRLRDDPTARLGGLAAGRYRDLLQQVTRERDDTTERVADTPVADAPVVDAARSSFSWLIVGPFLGYVIFGFIILGLAIVGIVALIRSLV